MNTLDSLKTYSQIVADTADFQILEQFQSIDTTTNPTLIQQACQQESFKPYLQKAMQWARKQGGEKKKILQNASVYLSVIIGCQALERIQGKVSTEVDAHLSFHTTHMIQQARLLVDLYRKEGIGRERILIKIASTWEGIQAAALLEKEGISCNMTLVFDLYQAMACAQAGATLISPFVGRISDWYQKNFPNVDYSGNQDPGVSGLKSIFYALKFYQYPTIVMGASFRTTQQILQVAGCDKLTISPTLLTQLASLSIPVTQELSTQGITPNQVPAITDQPIDEALFRWEMNKNEMATHLLADGIRRFGADQQKLEQNLLAFEKT